MIPMFAFDTDAQQRYLNAPSEQEAERLKQDKEALRACAYYQREKALQKENIVKAWLEFKRDCHERDKQRVFIDSRNTGNPDAKPLKKHLLEDWTRRYNKYGFAGLVDNRGKVRRGASSIPGDVQEYFKALWLQQSRPTVQACYRRCAEHFKQHDLPTYATFKNFTSTLDPAMVCLMREGQKSYRDKFEPYVLSDRGGMKSNAIWCADHHVFDVLVEHNGKIVRPWLSAWLDEGSGKLVGYVINFVASPNSNIVVNSFAAAVFSHGIPDKIHLDNGKDYKAYYVFAKGYVMSIANKLQIDVKYSIPYNAKAKIIERTFGSFITMYLKFEQSYIGSDTKKRDDKFQKLNKQIQKEHTAINSDVFLEHFAKIANDYNNTPSAGTGAGGRTPNQAYADKLENPRLLVTEEDRQLVSLALMRSPKALKVGRLGVRVRMDSHNTHYYTCDKLLTMQGQKVIVHYNAGCIDEVFIYNQYQEYVCPAQRLVTAKLDGSEEDIALIKATAHKKRVLKANVNANKPTLQTPSIDEFFTDRQADYPEPIADTTAVPAFAPNERARDNIEKIKADIKRKAERGKPDLTITSIGLTRAEITQNMFNMANKQKTGG